MRVLARGNSFWISTSNSRANLPPIYPLLPHLVASPSHQCTGAQGLEAPISYHGQPGAWGDVWSGPFLPCAISPRPAIREAAWSTSTAPEPSPCMEFTPARQSRWMTIDEEIVLILREPRAICARVRSSPSERGICRQVHSFTQTV